MEWINNLLNSFQSDALLALIAGIGFGLFAKCAVRLVVYAVILYIAVQLVQAAYAL